MNDKRSAKAIIKDKILSKLYKDSYYSAIPEGVIRFMSKWPGAIEKVLNHDYRIINYRKKVIEFIGSAMVEYWIYYSTIKCDACYKHKHRIYHTTIFMFCYECVNK